MANDVIIPGYETTIGSKLLIMVDHYGPASYSQATGDVYPVTNINRGGFDRVSAGTTLSGTYSVVAIMTPAAVGSGVTQVSLKWTVVSTGAQVANAVNLSAEVVRLEIFAY